jgi:hypothetical protein
MAVGDPAQRAPTTMTSYGLGIPALCAAEEATHIGQMPYVNPRFQGAGSRE